VKALTPVVLCCFSMGEMQLLMNTSPEQKREFERTALREFVALDQHIVDLGQRTALGRIAGLILSLDDRMSRRRLVADGAFEFPLRQEHIADATGLTGAHVNRVLTDMRNKGLIALPPRQLRILDRSGLVEACERR
jgi:CRP-like cAMP-binding protein